jgi:SAM-dependent methyltransferase
MNINKKYTDLKMKKLNFGCGKTCGWEEYKSFDNVDIQKNKSIHKSFNFEKYPYPIKDNTYDYVYTRSVLEHLERPDKVLLELWRICKPNAIIEIIVPSYNNRSAYDGIEHKHYFSITAFYNFVNDVDSNNPKKYFEIIKLEEAPSKVGRIFPKFLRDKLSLFIFGITSYVHVKLKVIK